MNTHRNIPAELWRYIYQFIQCYTLKAISSWLSFFLLFAAMDMLAQTKLELQWNKLGNLEGGDVQTIQSVDNNTLLVKVSNLPLQILSVATNIWTSSDIASNYVQSLAGSGHSMIATYNNTIYHSSDFGKSWVKTALPSGIARLSRPIKSGNTFIVIVEKPSGTLTSADDGVTWQFNAAPEIFASVQVNGNLLYAYSRSNNVYSSSDNGITWSPPTATGILSGRNFIIKDNDFYVTTGSAVYYSNDKGKSWKKYSPSKPSFIFNILATQTSLFLATYDGIFYSNDKGLTWERASMPVYNRCYSIFELQNVLYAGCEGSGLLFSKDNGKSWIPVPGLYAPLTTVVRSVNQNIVVGTHGNGLWTYSKNLNQWQRLSNTTVYPLINDVYFTGKNIITGTEQGLFVSIDLGKTWISPLTLPANGAISNIVQHQNSLFVNVWGNGVYKSDDNGLNWSLQYSLSDTLLIDRIFSIGDALFAWTEEEDSQTFDVFMKFRRSTDGGKNWSLTSISDAPIGSMFSYNNVLFASIGTPLLYAYGQSNTVFRSKDKGITWEAIVIPISIDSKCGIAALQDWKGTLLAATACDGLFYTKDMAQSWQKLSYSNIEFPIVDIILVDSKYVAGTWGGAIYEGVIPSQIAAAVRDVDEKNNIRVEPNVLSDNGNIKFTLEAERFVSVSLINILGQNRQTLFSGRLQAGSQTLPVNISSLPNGFYWCKVDIDNTFFQAIKVLVSH